MSGGSLIDNKAVGRRLERLRLALGYETQGEMAVALGIEVNRWNNFERGHPLSKDVAIRICQRFQAVTLDWLYFGRTDLLPVGLAKSLGELPGAVAPPSKTTSRPRRSSSLSNK